MLKTIMTINVLNMTKHSCVFYDPATIKKQTYPGWDILCDSAIEGM